MKKIDVPSFSNIPASSRDDNDTAMAALFTRLQIEDCLEQTKEIFKKGKEDATQELMNAFQFANKSAIVEFMRNKNVSEGTINFLKYLDLDKINLLIFTE